MRETEGHQAELIRHGTGRIPLTALPFLHRRLVDAIARSDHATYHRLLPSVRQLMIERDEARR